jgi:diaminohydroxyphosphoribosylaminopyrimidine deaminase/5-amino-6-(5-phosphoribosylamino)uracil reductase
MDDERYMQRCIQLASLGSGSVAPNPMVGSVLVYNNTIIGEGYHRQYGKAHAEVACIASVKAEHTHLISQSTLYVSLEPCAHWGKTPPCADLIIEKKIPKVVIGCRDPFAEVNGKGIEKLHATGTTVEVGILEGECKLLNRRFFTFHQEKRPYIILKWAETADGKMAGPEGASRLLITNGLTNRLVHKWRSEEAAILVGTNTALHDDPHLGTRLWPGKNPVRIVIDKNLRLPSSLQLFDGSIPTIIFNYHQHSLPPEKVALQDVTGVNYFQLSEGRDSVHQLVQGLHSLNIQSVLVEGGPRLLQSFIDVGMWDEARVICNEQLIISDGLPSPQLSSFQLIQSQTFLSDSVKFYKLSGKSNIPA